jgi:hypothetical protein
MAAPGESKLPFSPEALFGPVAIGAFFNCFLAMLYLVEAISYCLQYLTKDRRRIKACVALMSCIVFLNAIVTCISVWEFTVAHWGDLLWFATKWPWAASAGTALTGLAAACCQCFLLYRFYKV